jgi:hypothetical protein
MKFNIRRINFFEEQIFSNVRVTLCSFDFFLHDNSGKETRIFIFPEGKQFNIDLSSGEFVNLTALFKIDDSIKISKKTTRKGKLLNATSLVLQTTDSSKNKEIGIFFSEKKNYNSLQVPISINILLSTNEQLTVMHEFNSILKELRQKYSSLIFSYFLSCKYSGFKRKKISLKVAFHILNYIIKNFKNNRKKR